MRILVCVKRVPAPGARINVTDDGQSVETAHLGFTTSPHEECAVEEAVQLVEEHGGEVTVLTLGAPEAEEQLRYAASVGAQRIVLVPTDENIAGWDPQRTAAALTEAIEGIEGDGGPFDLILFGNESADSGGFQVGIRVAHAMGRPIVNGIKSTDLDGDSVVARKAVEGGFEVYRLPMPAMLGVKEGINLPRYPTMKGRLASKKVEMDTNEVDADAGGQAMVRLKRPEETVSNTEIIGTDASEETAAKVVDLLEELGVLS
ncbi:MAG: electron transfer flavoprotein subunit beta/FixA family protein [Actinomycetota bacterium]